MSASKIKDGAIGDSKLSSSEMSRWAVVDTGGTLVRGKGVVSAVKNPPAPAGSYNVKFDRDITECSWVGTMGSGDSSGSSFGSIRTLLATGTTDTVNVRTGTTIGANNDRKFHLSVQC